MTRKYAIELTWPQVEIVRRALGQFDGENWHQRDRDTLDRAERAFYRVHYRPTRAERQCGIGATTGGFR